MKKILLLLIALLTTSSSIYATNYYWHPTSGTNWNTVANWDTGSYSGGSPTVLPGRGDNVIIGNSSTNFTVILNVNDTIANLTLQGSGQLFINTSTSSTLSVTGNITDNNTATTGGGSATIIIGGSGSQYIYGNSSYTKDVGKLPNLSFSGSGTTYLSGYITMGGSTALTYSSGAINAGTSDVIFYYANTINGNFISGNALYNVEFQGNGGNHTIEDTITVGDSLVISGSSSGNLNTGYIKAEGNITVTSTFTFNGNPTGSATIIVCGSGTQTLTGSGTVGKGCLCNLTIKNTGTLTLSSIITTGGNWTFSSGTVSAATNSLVAFYYAQTITGSMTFYNVGFYAVNNNRSYTIASGTTLTVTNNLIIGPTYYLRLIGGTIDVKDSLTVTNTDAVYSSPGTTAIVFTGSGNHYLIGNTSVNSGELPNINIDINATSTLYLEKIISVMGTWRYTQGKIVCNAGNLVAFTYDDSIVGSDTLRNVEFDPFGNDCYYTFSPGSALTVTDSLTFGATNGINLDGGTINAKGNIYINNTRTGRTPGTDTIIINGTGSQTIYGNGVLDGCKLPNVTIDKASGTLFLEDTISFGNRLTYTAGAVDDTTHPNLSVFCYQNTINGNNLTLNGVMFYADLGITSYSIAGGDTLTTGNLYINNTGSNTNAIGGSGVLKVKGNMSNSSTLSITCGNLIMNGSSNQAMPGTTTATISTLTIKNASGVTLNNTLSLASNLNLTTGIIASTSSDLLTFNNGSTVSGASNSSFVSGPVKKIGNAAFRFPTGAGSIYNPVAISAPSSTTDAFTAQYFNTGSTTSTLDGVLTYIDPCEYWNLTHNVGSSNVHDTLFWNTPCFYIPNLYYLKIGYVSGTTWTTSGTCTTSGTTTNGKISCPTGIVGNISLALDNSLVYAHAGSNVTICSASSTTLGASPAGTGGVGTLHYSWSPTTSLSSSTVANPSGSPTTTTTYTLTVTDSITEYGTSSIVVTVNPTPGDNAGSNTAICNGAGTTIGATSTSGHTYSWSPSTGLSSSTVSNPTASPTLTSTYTLTEAITATGCSASNGIIVTINPLPGDDAGANRAICNGSSTTIGSAGTSGHTYDWSPSSGLSSSTVSNPTASPASTSTYSLTETITATGCSAVNVITITINSNPAAHAGGDFTFCKGGSATIGANPSATGGSSPYTYSWSPSSGLNSSTLGQPVATPTITTSYILTATDINSCMGKDTMVFTIHSNPIAYAGDDTSLCIGKTGKVGLSTGASSGSPPYTYQWSPTSGLNNSTVANPTANPQIPTIYTLTVTDANSCQATDAVKVSVDTCNPCGP